MLPGLALRDGPLSCINTIRGTLHVCSLAGSATFLGWQHLLGHQEGARKGRRCAWEAQERCLLRRRGQGISTVPPPRSLATGLWVADCASALVRWLTNKLERRCYSYCYTACLIGYVRFHAYSVCVRGLVRFVCAECDVWCVRTQLPSCMHSPHPSTGDPHPDIMISHSVLDRFG
jgi:hypothetical protein